MDDEVVVGLHYETWLEQAACRITFAQLCGAPTCRAEPMAPAGNTVVFDAARANHSVSRIHDGFVSLPIGRLRR